MQIHQWIEVSAFDRYDRDQKFNIFFYRSLNSTFDGDIFELLFSLSDFQTFKAMMVDYKEYKTGKYKALDLNDVFIVKKINWDAKAIHR